LNIRFLRLPWSGPRSKIEPILFEWFTLIGMFLFAAWLLGLKGVWQLLLQSDPTGITFIIIVIFCIATAWCGTRSRELDRQRQSLEQQISDASASPIDGCWASAYWKALRAKPADAAAPLDLLRANPRTPFHCVVGKWPSIEIRFARQGDRLLDAGHADRAHAEL